MIKGSYLGLGLRIQKMGTVPFYSLNSIHENEVFSVTKEMRKNFLS